MAKKDACKVRIVAYNKKAEIVEELILTHEEYYEESVKMIDSAEFRATHGIVRIDGKIHDPAGKLDQHFINNYSTDGKLVKNRTTFADGTVIES